MNKVYKIASVLIGILFLVYFVDLFDELPKINFREFLSTVNYFYVALSFLAYLLSHVLRAIRIAVLMGRQDYSLIRLIYMQLYTNSINLIVPFKLGEVYRVVEFNKLIQDPKKLLFTIVTEKTLDLLLLFGWALLAIGFLGYHIVGLKIVIWIISSLIITSMVIFFVLPENIRTFNLFVAKRYNTPWVLKLLAFNDQLATVIANIKSTVRTSASTILLLTFVIWMLEVLGFSYLLPFMVQKSQIWLLSILVFLSSLIPSVSLGLGGLQLGFAALDYNSSQYNSLVISLTYQAFIFAPGVVLGLLLHLYVTTKERTLANSLS